MLHHYHKIGLLIPQKISEAGYRLYGQEELERLQQILYFRELDFSLDTIREALSAGTDRLVMLKKQGYLLVRRRHLNHLIKTLDTSIDHATMSEPMNAQGMFDGFNEAQWRDALSE